jgi:hypothetical protein
VHMWVILRRDQVRLLACKEKFLPITSYLRQPFLKDPLSEGMNLNEIVGVDGYPLDAIM